MSETLSRRLSPAVTVERQEAGGSATITVMSTAIVIPAESSQPPLKVDITTYEQVAQLVGEMPTDFEYEPDVVTWVADSNVCRFDKDGDCITPVDINFVASDYAWSMGEDGAQVFHHGTVLLTGDGFSELPEETLSAFDYAQEVTYDEALSIVQSRGIHY